MANNTSMIEIEIHDKFEVFYKNILYYKIFLLNFSFMIIPIAVQK